MQLLPFDQLKRKLQRLRVIADEVVIDNEYFVAPTQFAQYVELPDDLSWRFRPGPAAVDGNDVAKFALEGASAGELNRHRGVFVPMQQVETGYRATRHVRFIDNVVQSLCCSAFKRSGNSWESLLRLADHDVISYSKRGLGVCARPGAADEGPFAEGAGAAQDMQCIGALGVHGAYHHQVGPLQIFIPQFFEGVVDQTDLPGCRTQCGDGDQP